MDTDECDIPKRKLSVPSRAVTVATTHYEFREFESAPTCNDELFIIFDHSPERLFQMEYSHTHTHDLRYFRKPNILVDDPCGRHKNGWYFIGISLKYICLSLPASHMGMWTWIKWFTCINPSSRRRVSTLDDARLNFPGSKVVRATWS